MYNGTEVTANDAVHTMVRTSRLWLWDSARRARSTVRAMFKYLSKAIKVMVNMAAPKKVSVAGATYRQNTLPKDHLKGSCSFKMPIGKLKIRTPMSEIAKLKRYWLVGPSTFGFRMIIIQTIAFPMIPKKPMAIWKPILKIVTANGSLRYTGNVTLVSVQLEAMLLINGLALCGSDDKNDSQ